MSTLWTPDGERRVPPADDPASSGTPPREPASPVPDDTAAGDAAVQGGAEELSGDPLRAAAAALGVDLDSLDDDERAQLAAELAEMMEVRRQVAATPAADMVTNHLMRLFDLVTIYLEADPPAFADAATVIEAFRSVLDGVGERLGENEALLRQALGQAQMLFVQVKSAAEGTPG